MEKFENLSDYKEETRNVDCGRFSFFRLFSQRLYGYFLNLKFNKVPVSEITIYFQANNVYTFPMHQYALLIQQWFYGLVLQK